MIPTFCTLDLQGKVKIGKTDLPVDHEETSNAVTVAIGGLRNLATQGPSRKSFDSMQVPRLAIQGKVWNGSEGFEGKLPLMKTLSVPHSFPKTTRVSPPDARLVDVQYTAFIQTTLASRKSKPRFVIVPK
ncbi:hypothetical protein HGRIS_002937 [Hohenbuehelia grisea]|uniref:Uncharacterized protein n=1 Tax=Hohenbuehelia grisea TaxID=104357 RepID=A0ABR3JMP9_9AGAR